jgi:O-antigen/teichoic acid export membrane protein
VRARRHIGIGVLARGWSQLTAMLIAILAARLLGKNAFGIYAIASIFIVLLQGLIFGGIYDYIIKNRDEDLDSDTCFWMNLGLSVVGAAVIVMLAPIMAVLVHSQMMMLLMMGVAPSALVAALTSWQEALLLRQGKLTAFYSVGLMTETAAAAIGVAALLSGFGLWSLVIYRYAQLALASLCYFWMVPRLPRMRWHPDTARSALGFSGDIAIGRLVANIATYSSDLLIGILVNPAAAGAYRLANRVVLGISEVAYQPATTMAWVHFSDAGEDEAALQREWLALISLLSLTVWPALAGLAFMSGTVIHLLVGKGWSEAIPVVALIAVSRMIALFQVFFDAMLGVRNRTGMLVKIRCGAAVGSIAALILLVRYGAVGAATASIIVSLAVSLLAVRIGMVETRLRLRTVMAALAPGVAATCATLVGAAVIADLAALTADPVMEAILTVAGGIAGWGFVLLIVYRRRLPILHVAV